MPEIPEKLKWYQPLKLGSSNTPPAWRMSIDEMTGCVEIKRAPLIRMFSVFLGFILAVIIGGLLCAVYIYAPIRGNDKMLLAGCIVFFPLLMIVCIPAVDALMIVLNSMHWKGRLRFRFDPQNSELFFPRENVTYQLKDCSKLVLGCVRGTDMEKAVKRFGVWWKMRGGKHSTGLAPVTQIFILVLDKNNEWHRYNITDDCIAHWTKLGSKQFLGIVEKLQPHLELEVFVKDYSKDECFAQQNSNATAQ